MIMLNETDLLQANGGFIGAALRVAQIGGRTVTRKLARKPKTTAALIGVPITGLQVADTVRIGLQEGNA